MLRLIPSSAQIVVVIRGDCLMMLLASAEEQAHSQHREKSFLSGNREGHGGLRRGRVFSAAILNSLIVLCKRLRVWLGETWSALHRPVVAVVAPLRFSASGV